MNYLSRPEGPQPSDFTPSRRAAVGSMFFAGYAAYAFSADAAPITTPDTGLKIEEVVIPNGEAHGLPDASLDADRLGADGLLADDGLHRTAIGTPLTAVQSPSEGFGVMVTSPISMPRPAAPPTTDKDGPVEPRGTTLITTTRLIRIGLLLLVLALVGYVAYQFLTFAGTPELTVTDPPADLAAVLDKLQR